MTETSSRWFFFGLPEERHPVGPRGWLRDHPGLRHDPSGCQRGYPVRHGAWYHPQGLVAWGYGRLGTAACSSGSLRSPGCRAAPVRWRLGSADKEGRLGSAGEGRWLGSAGPFARRLGPGPRSRGPGTATSASRAGWPWLGCAAAPASRGDAPWAAAGVWPTLLDTVTLRCSLSNVYSSLRPEHWRGGTEGRNGPAPAARWN